MKPRFYLAVPYAQKDEAKGLGARWDPTRKRWYVPEGLDLSVFQRWAPEIPEAEASPAGKAAKSQVRPHDAPGVVIPSADPNFIPYPGEAPPWE